MAGEESWGQHLLRDSDNNVYPYLMELGERRTQASFAAADLERVEKAIKHHKYNEARQMIQEVIASLRKQEK